MSNRRATLKEKPARSKAFYEALAAVANINGAMSIPPPAPSQLRWTCYHRVGVSDIDAFVPATGHLETVAQTLSLSGVSARANAELIVKAVNGYNLLQPTLSELVNVIERWCASGNLVPVTRQEAETVIRRARRVVGV